MSWEPQRKNGRLLYFAYGSNLSVAQMKKRCPKARKFKPLYITDGRLVFRGHADLQTFEGGRIAGGLWEITEECERALDWNEGVSTGTYAKRYLTFRMSGGAIRDCLFYKMRLGGIQPPSQEYLNTIAQGYRDFDLDLSLLDEALERSWHDKDVTSVLRARHIKRGRPTLAKARGIVPVRKAIKVA